MADDKGSARIEMATAILLSAAGVATAWASYQASLWGGIQASHFAQATNKLTEASQMEILGGQTATIDTAVFIEWADAAYDGDTDRQAFLEARFTDEFRAAFEQWRAGFPADLKGFQPPAELRPIKTPRADYPEMAAARTAREDARAHFEAGEEANSHGDRFVAVTVLLSAVLFLGGISQLLKRPRPRTVALSLAGLIGLAAVGWMLTLPASSL